MSNQSPQQQLPPYDPIASSRPLEDTPRMRELAQNYEPMSNLPNETLLELWEGMFGSNKAAKAEPYTIDYKEFSKRVQAYGDTRELEGRIDELGGVQLQYGHQLAITHVEGYGQAVSKRFADLIALKDKK